jgi:hypothetical protein
MLNTTASKNGFESAFDGWFKESKESIVMLALQKSNFGNFYYLNIKTFIQGVFNRNYTKNKDLVKKEGGNIFVRQPKEYDVIFDLESPLSDDERRQKLESLFTNYIVPFTGKALHKTGIYDLGQNGEINLRPEVKMELDRIEDVSI